MNAEPLPPPFLHYSQCNTVTVGKAIHSNHLLPLIKEHTIVGQKESIHQTCLPKRK